MAAVSRKVSRCFARVALAMQIGSIREKQFHKVSSIGDRGGEDGREPARLRRVNWRAMFEQQPDRFRIFAQRQHRVQRLILLRIAAHRVDVRAG